MILFGRGKGQQIQESDLLILLYRSLHVVISFTVTAPRSIRARIESSPGRKSSFVAMAVPLCPPPRQTIFYSWKGAAFALSLVLACLYILCNSQRLPSNSIVPRCCAATFRYVSAPFVPKNNTLFAQRSSSPSMSETSSWHFRSRLPGARC